MPIPHAPACPCLRCYNRRKPEAAKIETLIAESSVGRACSVMKKAASWPKAPVEQDGLSTRPTAHSPKGPSGAAAIEWVRERRRRELAAERDER